MSAINKNNVFEFIGCDCRLVTHHYSNNNSLAIQVVTADTKNNIDNFVFPGEPVGWLSVNTDSDAVGKGEFAIKTYSENAGLFQVVLEAGLIRDTGKTVDVGFGNILPVAILT